MERAQTGVAVLVVEDEALIRMMFEDVLLELGHSIAAQAGDLATGLTFAKQRDYRLAILDVNLNGRPAFPIADVVRARGKALLFVTGYGSAGLAADYKGAAVLQKPFTPKELSGAISSALGGRS
jgi:DNA-binding response OmpR family regulator